MTTDKPMHTLQTIYEEILTYLSHYGEVLPVNLEIQGMKWLHKTKNVLAYPREEIIQSHIFRGSQILSQLKQSVLEKGVQDV